MGNGTSWVDAILRPGANVRDGIYSFATEPEDVNIAYYREIGGARILERADVPFSMTALDTPVLREGLSKVAPPYLNDIVVDVGGGDGRYTLPWLERGYQRIVVIDPAGEALKRLRSRVESTVPGGLERIAFVEADARALPLVDGCATTVLAIESLYYLNEDYEIGLRECVRTLKSNGQILLSERDTEGALMMQLLYFGISAMLKSRDERSVWDGAAQRVRTRSFSEEELRETLERAGLKVESITGTSLLALILGWMNANGKIFDGDRARLGAVRTVLAELGVSGRMRRCHLAIARL